METPELTPELVQPVLEANLGLTPRESLLVVTDTMTEQIGHALFLAGLQLGSPSMLMVVPPSGRNGAEPPPAAAAAMLHADVIVCPTRFSLSHTQARLQATETGARVATMPGVHPAMLWEGPITADLSQVERRTVALQRLLSGADNVRVVTGDDSQLRFSIRGRDGRVSTGRLLGTGAFGNLPSGEAYLAPIEGTAEGELVVNASISGIGRLESALKLEMHEGLLTNAVGTHAHQLLEILGDRPEARNVAEFGIGTNDRARITGVILEDEKALGTIHIAFGDNSTFGGNVRAGIHIDTVIKDADVFLDDVQIMSSGHLGNLGDGL